jgi:transposase
VIDPHARYARAVRELLPHAVLAVDHFHLVLLANCAVAAVRQRVTRELLHRRGRASDPAWANRRLLLRARERLSEKALARMWNGCVDHDPTAQILTSSPPGSQGRTTRAVRPRRPRRRPDRNPPAALDWTFYSWCADARIPESSGGDLRPLDRQHGQHHVPRGDRRGRDPGVPRHCTGQRQRRRRYGVAGVD